MQQQQQEQQGEHQQPKGQGGSDQGFYCMQGPGSYRLMTVPVDQGLGQLGTHPATGLGSGLAQSALLGQAPAESWQEGEGSGLISHWGRDLWQVVKGLEGDLGFSAMLGDAQNWGLGSQGGAEGETAEGSELAPEVMTTTGARAVAEVGTVAGAEVKAGAAAGAAGVSGPQQQPCWEVVDMECFAAG